MRSLLRLPSQCDQHFDRFTVVHCPVALRNLIESRDSIEDPTGLNPSVKNVCEQFLDVGTRRRNAATDRHVASERRQSPRNRFMLRETHTAHRTARACDVERSNSREIMADTFENRMGAEAP